MGEAEPRAKALKPKERLEASKSRTESHLGKLATSKSRAETHIGKLATNESRAEPRPRKLATNKPRAEAHLGKLATNTDYGTQACPSSLEQHTTSRTQAYVSSLE